MCPNAAPVSNAGVQEAEHRIPVGEGALFVRIEGQGPWTVLLDAGWGRWSPIWRSVQARLRDRFATVAFDRMGLGRSDPGAMPRSAFQVVDELQEGLRVLGLEGPFLLVGEGFGAVHARVHAFRDPAVKGMVLVDPVTEVWARSKGFSTYRFLFERNLKRWTRRAGFRMARITAWLTRWPVPGLSVDAAKEMRLGLEPDNFFAMRAELGALEESLQQLAMVGAPSVPTTVLSPARRIFSGMISHDDSDPVGTVQRKLGLQAPEGRHVVVDGPDRCLPVDHPEAVAEAVVELAGRLTIPVQGATAD